VGIFIGTYHRSLDGKNRLLLPSRLFPGGRPEKLYLGRGFECAASIYDEEGFQALLTRLKELDYRRADDRAFLTLAAGSLAPLDIDAQGRVLIPSDLKEAYGLGDKVVVVGVLDHLDLFAEDAYKDYVEKEGERYQEIAETLAGRNL